ncbi:hypothetical protein, partial [Micromonospora inaquosa]|uniref:hypothetical protein n=1 Tax=Micromonospora inaquosa TaxID=2203716 RepID=UPI001ABF8D5B
RRPSRTAPSYLGGTTPFRPPAQGARCGTALTGSARGAAPAVGWGRTVRHRPLAEGGPGDTPAG